MLIVSSCGYNKKKVVSPPGGASVAQRPEASMAIEPKTVTAPSPPVVRLEPEVIDSQKEGEANEFSEEDSFLPDVDYVRGRISEYGRKLDRWKELDNQTLVVELDEQASEEMLRCFRELQKIHGGYERVYNLLQQQDFMGSTGLVSSHEMIKLEQQDILFLESECGRLLSSGHVSETAGWPRIGGQGNLEQLESLIEHSSRNNEFEEVIQTWQQIPESQLERVGLKSRMFYGNALMALHQGEEAANIYSDIIDRVAAARDESTDIFFLRKTLADIHTATGNYEKAAEEYRLISTDYKTLGLIESWAGSQLAVLEGGSAGSTELLEYSSILRNSLGFIPQRDGYKLVWQCDTFLADFPLSPVAANVGTIKASAQRRADQWMAQFLVEVDALAEEERFQDALLMLGTLEEDILSGERLIEVRKKSDDLTLAAAVSSETRKLEEMRALEQRWNEALLLIDGKAYDEGIEVLSSLLDTDFAARADAKIAEASLMAARAERRRAADLFIQYTKATDLESKKKLLIESRRCLKDILIKYPDVGITDKVLGNIKRVEKEMNGIDPMLISQSELVGQEVEEEQGVEENLQVEETGPSIAPGETGPSIVPQEPQWQRIE